MKFATRMYRGDTDINFPVLWKKTLAVSTLLVIVGLVFLGTQGLNLAIEFEGGSQWEVPTETMTVDEAEAVLDEFGKAEGSKIQVVTDAQDSRILKIQAAESDNVEQSQEIAAAFATAADLDVTEISANTVGPTWGEKITKDAAKALVIFLILVALYISWQLEWRMALSALVAVIHDVIITVGFYSVFQFEVTPATVISILTILGYSLYDTIVVYDRVLENSSRFERSGQYTAKAIMRRSLNQVLMRSLNTTIASILPVLAILVIGGVAYGQAVMFDFALALLVGLVAGTYSSLFIASPLLVWFKERETRYKTIRERAVNRGTENEADWIPPVNRSSVQGQTRPSAAADDGSVATATIAEADAASKAAKYQRAHPPRPRKQGKKR